MGKGPRFTAEQFANVLGKRGYGIQSAFGAKGVASQLRAGAINNPDNGAGKVNNLESDPGDASLGSKKLQIGCSGKVRVRVTFYRRRLADYGEGCSRAISEKALIDSAVYAGLIQGDSGEEIWLEDGGQKKVASDEEERTEIELTYQGVNLDNPWVKAKENKAR